MIEREARGARRNRGRETVGEREGRARKREGGKVEVRVRER
mgnify:CR=1 FL=1